jgi:sec-independent protein translocase protein TatA
MPGGIGPLELIIVLVILLIIFGPKRLPGLGRSIGTGMREFKDSISGRGKDDDEDEDDAGRPALEATTAQPVSEPARERAAEPRP